MNRGYALSIILILFLPHHLTAAERSMMQGGDVSVLYDAPLEAVAREVIRIYPGIKRELEIKLHAETDITPTVILLKDRDSFQKITGSNIVVAVAVSESNLIVIDNSKMKTHPFSLEVTLKHELCHLFLNSYAGAGNLPRWLNEGVAQWASDGIAEIVVGEERDLLKKATLSGRLIPLSRLASEFPAEEHLMRLSYEQSKSLVEYIIREFGTEGIRDILNSLKRGSTIHDAVLNSLNVSLYELEDRWHAYLKRRITWFTYFSSHIYEVLFTLAALFLTYGFVKFLIRKRAYRDEEDDVGDENGPPR